MRALLVTPFTPLSKNFASHRSAQGVIYADQLKNAGINVHLAMTGKIPEDYNEFDEMYVYHGNDWFGTLNMFGGVKNYANIDSVIKISKFKGKVYSIGIEYPDYYTMLKDRVDKTPDAHPQWRLVDWDGLLRLQKESKVVDPNFIRRYPYVSIGDSHAISMYRPGWMNISVPFKTLHGALSVGLKSFVPEGEYNDIEFYFGNIDVRHHFCRMPNPDDAVKKTVANYVHQAAQLATEKNCQVTLYELLPIEDESRKLPQTGYYKGRPFSGTREQRDKIRLLFKEEMFKQCTTFYKNVKVFEWVDKITNSKGELDFMYMEKPQSVHLSREYYPHWQGKDWNERTPKTGNLLNQFMC